MEGPFRPKNSTWDGALWGSLGQFFRSSKTDLIGHSHRIAAKQVTKSQIALQRRIVRDSPQHHRKPRPPHSRKEELVDNKVLDINRVSKRKLSKSSHSQQSRIDIDRCAIFGALNLPVTVLIMVFIALSLGQLNVVYQGISLAISSILFVGLLALVGMGRPSHSYDIFRPPRYTGARFQSSVRTRQIQWSRSHPSSSKRFKVMCQNL